MWLICVAHVAGKVGIDLYCQLQWKAAEVKAVHSDNSEKRTIHSLGMSRAAEAHHTLEHGSSSFGIRLCLSSLIMICFNRHNRE